MKNEYCAEVGRRIRELRVARGMTQEELATALGKSGRSYISKIELGDRDIDHCEIARLSAVLNATPGYIVLGEELQESNLTPIEQDLIDKYRTLPSWMQRLARDNLNALYREKQEYDKMQKNEA